MTDPADIAITDQCLAGSREAVKITITAMKQMLDTHPPNVEQPLIELIDALMALCENDPDTTNKIIINYVTAIYELAKND